MKLKLVTVVAIALLIAPPEPVAQQPAKVPTVGYLSPAGARNPITDAFEQALRESGWVRNQNIRIEERAVAGGMMSYAPSLSDVARRGAAYVDRILKGAAPGTLPVEQPTKFEFVVNMKTAKALGLKIPQTLLVRADNVIE